MKFFAEIGVITTVLLFCGFFIFIGYSAGHDIATKQCQEAK